MLSPVQPSDSMDRAAAATITIEFVDHSQPTVHLPGPVVRLGRSPSADLVIPGAEISANHAKLVLRDGELVVFDTESKNGTFVNDRRVPRAKLRPGDVVRLGPSGPPLHITHSGEGAPAGETALKDIAPDRTVGMQSVGVLPDVGAAEVLGDFPVGERMRLGRDADCDLRLDSLHVSGKHALIWRHGAEVRVRDLNSTNGTFVGRLRVGDTTLLPGAQIIIGPFFLRFDGASLRLFDTRGRTWVEARSLSHRIGGKQLLDEISLAVQPGEFLGLLGPSGAGKSMLLRSLCGALHASGGQVLVNGLDFYQNYAQLKSLIGYVPQDDIIHTQLTVEETLRYAALLRLPAGLGREVREQRVSEVLSALELQNHAQLPAYRLSGGQRKRLSMGVELLNEPNLLFLDEPTAGLDPNLEEKMMVLLRELALRGKTIICVTHVLDHIELCDRIALLQSGHMVFLGTPRDALGHFGVQRLAEAYHVLEEHSPEPWKGEAAAPEREVTTPPEAGRLPRRRRSGPGPLSQLVTLSRRYTRILTGDLRHSLILLAQAPILGLLIALATRSGTPGWRPTSVMYLMLSLSAFWFGCVNAAREITKETAVTQRERMVGVGVMPYIFSKLLVLQALALVQVAILLLMVDWLGPPRQLGNGVSYAVILGGLPGSYPLALVNLYLTALNGIGLGLLISSLAGNSDKAMSLVPLALLPQILFAGALAVPKAGSVARILGYLVGVNWSFDLFRRELACTHEELFAKAAPDCLVAFDPNRTGDVTMHVKAQGREIVLLIKDGLYSIPVDLAVMAGMVVLFFVLLALLQWRKRPA
jgi:ABC transport system ATP-binding/permease protein